MQTQFTFDPSMRRNVGYKKFLSGTPSVIAMAGIASAGWSFEQVTSRKLRKNSSSRT